jgi:hypothetical protein
MRQSRPRCNFPVALYNTTLNVDEASFRLTALAAAGGGVGDINLFHYTLDADIY